MSKIVEQLLHPSEVVAMVRVLTKSKPRCEEEAQSVEQRYAYKMLNKTSRSFAAVIQALPVELRDATCIFYLVLRALDTIEDDMESLPVSEKKVFLENFYTSLDAPIGSYTYPKCGYGDEKDLVENFDKIVAVHQSLKPIYREVIADICKRMGAGMSEFASRPVDNTDDWNLYCHYVAGLVGHGLTRLFGSSGLEDPSYTTRLDDADDLGLFLQKTNIIRDYLEDWVDKRTFWPRDVWSKYATSLGDFTKPEHQDAGLQCLNELVATAVDLVPSVLSYCAGLRNPHIFQFVAIPQVMAIATLTLCYNNADVFKKVVKIRKGEACKLLLETNTMEDVYVTFARTLRKLKAKIPAHDPTAARLHAAIIDAENAISEGSASLSGDAQLNVTRALTGQDSTLPAGAYVVAVLGAGQLAAFQASKASAPGDAVPDDVAPSVVSASMLLVGLVWLFFTYGASCGLVRMFREEKGARRTNLWKLQSILSAVLFSLMATYLSSQNTKPFSRVHALFMEGTSFFSAIAGISHLIVLFVGVLVSSWLSDENNRWNPRTVNAMMIYFTFFAGALLWFRCVLVQAATSLVAAVPAAAPYFASLDGAVSTSDACILALTHTLGFMFGGLLRQDYYRRNLGGRDRDSASMSYYTASGVLIAVLPFVCEFVWASVGGQVDADMRNAVTIVAFFGLLSGEVLEAKQHALMAALVLVIFGAFTDFLGIASHLEAVFATVDATLRPASVESLGVLIFVSALSAALSAALSTKLKERATSGRMPARDTRERTIPEDVGIIAMEVYAPLRCVEQSAFEEHNGVSAGKYTLGLGQTRMAFCGDREDINSIALTVVRNLLDKHEIDPRQVGRLEVGTETLVDKSKSVKTVLMQLFEDSGNTDIEGIDTTNACYGGTNALFNSINWLESSAWDGRYAIVVCGDVAVYADGPARPTGGAGAVAMLLGPHAPLVVDRGVRSSHFEHAWDFYKPQMESEYPTVDGKISIQCFLRAVDKTYATYRSKVAKSAGAIDRSYFDYCVWHTPFNKLVQKAYGRLMYNDFAENPNAPEFDAPELKEYMGLSREESYTHPTLEKAFVNHSKKEYQERVIPGTLLSKECGNMYTASLYSSLASLIHNTDDLMGKRIMMFSYGSGFASTLFSITVRRSTKKMAKALEVDHLLSRRKVVSPAEFSAAMLRREKTHNDMPFKPTDRLDTLPPGTFYLQSIDDMGRRKYSRTATA